MSRKGKCVETESRLWPDWGQRWEWGVDLQMGTRGLFGGWEYSRTDCSGG